MSDLSPLCAREQKSLARELGWIGGRNFTIEYRWAEGSSDRAAELYRDGYLRVQEVF